VLSDGVGEVEHDEDNVIESADHDGSIRSG
jgi:hypothetical protein